MVNCALWWDLKWFRTAEKMKRRMVNCVLWRDLKRFRTVEKNEKKDGKLCIAYWKRFRIAKKMTVFEMIWSCGKKWKQGFGIFMSRLGDANPSICLYVDYVCVIIKTTEICNDGIPVFGSPQGSFFQIV